MSGQWHLCLEVGLPSFGIVSESYYSRYRIGSVVVKRVYVYLPTALRLSPVSVEDALLKMMEQTDELDTNVVTRILSLIQRHHQEHVDNESYHRLDFVALLTRITSVSDTVQSRQAQALLRQCEVGCLLTAGKQ